MAGVRNWYFGIFAFLYTGMTVVVIIREIRAKDDIIEILFGVIIGLGAAAMAAAASAFTLTEIGRDGMVLAKSIEKWFNDRRNKRLAEAREEGLEEGIGLGRKEGIGLGRKEGLEEGIALGEVRVQEWIEWNARREEAESRGEDFIEPPPNGKL